MICLCRLQYFFFALIFVFINVALSFRNSRFKKKNSHPPPKIFNFKVYGRQTGFAGNIRKSNSFEGLLAGAGDKLNFQVTCGKTNDGKRKLLPSECYCVY